MLRVVSHKSAAAASQYYSQGLSREDYYSEKQEVAGKWHGKAAKLLGLSGKVSPEAFAALVDNRHPVTGEKLTPRMKAGRIVGYDLNFHAPKSLSILHALTKDERIVEAFRAAVAETMAEIEGQIETRVRKRGAKENCVTGNMAWAEFVHFTSRPVGKIPDPHLHVHCFAFNATFDGIENRWKAGNFRDIKKEAPYSEAAFHARLTAKLSALGYGIDRTKFGWEIAGIGRGLIERFSRRTDQINKLAEKKGITDPRQKDGLAASSREGKRHGLTRSDLLSEWQARLSEEEKAGVSGLYQAMKAPPARPRITPAQAMDYAIEKLFAKNSVVVQNRLIAEAMRFGVGHLEPGQVWQEFEKRGMISRRVGGEYFCTSADVLAEEISLINFVRTGRSMCAPMRGRDFQPLNPSLSGEQKSAVRHVLQSPDQVIVVKGGAGVGKTTLMKEVVPAIMDGGYQVFAFAPSAVASRETLREAGFENAETVAHLLINTKLQERIRGQVIWIDEAGLLGIRDMWQVMRLAGNSTRVILTGDAGQHSPVARGDAFRLMQKYAGLKIAEVTKIRRQKQEEYKKAVESLSKGDLRTGFRRLDEMGAIIEVEDASERYRMLAADFIELSRRGQVPLVLSPTHAESRMVTAAIRETRQEAGELGSERSFIQYHNLQWEVADRKRAENYVPGLIVQFHQNCWGIRRSEQFQVMGHDGKGRVLLLNADGREAALPLQYADRFLVYEQREIRLAKGDLVKITRNGQSADGKRLNNGNVFTVAKFSKTGEIILSNGGALSKEHGHLTYGYCHTSHSSQSKSVRDVLVAQSSQSFGAASKEQFYVSVSRAKHSIRIYTDSRDDLQHAVGNSSTRRAGIELAEIKTSEISSMSTALNSREWYDAIRKRQAEGQAMTHVPSNVKGEDSKQDFKNYLKSRRELVQVSGGKNIVAALKKHAEKTKEPKKAGSVPEKKVQDSQLKGTKSKKGTLLEKTYRNAAANFKKVVERGKKVISDKRKKDSWPQSNIKQVASHAKRQRAIDKMNSIKGCVKIDQKNVATPPPPAPRRGK